jgi:hypothetical protein
MPQVVFLAATKVGGIITYNTLRAEFPCERALDPKVTALKFSQYRSVIVFAEIAAACALRTSAPTRMTDIYTLQFDAKDRRARRRADYLPSGMRRKFRLTLWRLRANAPQQYCR